MDKRLIVFGNASEKLLRVAHAHIKRASEAMLVTVVRKSGDGYIVQGNINLTGYASGAIVKPTPLNPGDNTNAVFSINIPMDELDENSIKALDDYEARIRDLYEYLVQVEEGEIENTRFDGKYEFDDFFILNEDGTIRNVILKPGLGLGYPTFEFDGGWAAFVVEFRQEGVTNPYHKISNVRMGDDTYIKITANNGGSKPQRCTEDELLEEFDFEEVETPKSSASTGSRRPKKENREEEIPYAEDAPKGRRLRSGTRRR